MSVDFWKKEMAKITDNREVLDKKVLKFSTPKQDVIFKEDAYDSGRIIPFPTRSASDDNTIFLTGNAMLIFENALHNGFSIPGIALAIAWSAYEGGFKKNGDNNLFGTFNKVYSTPQESIDDWLRIINLPQYGGRVTSLLKANIIDSDSFSHALNASFYTNNNLTYNGDKTDPKTKTLIVEDGIEVAYLDYGYRILNLQMLSVFSRIEMVLNTELKRLFSGQGDETLTERTRKITSYLGMIRVKNMIQLYDTENKIGKYGYKYKREDTNFKTKGEGAGNITEIQLKSN